MSKFWTVVTILLITGLVLLAVDRAEAPEINFSDLETECRYDTTPSTDIGLSGDQITFSGRFNAPNPSDAPDYSYRKSGSNINLDITTKDSMVPDSFYNNCLASVVYEAETGSLEPGDYNVNLYHNGNLREKVVIRVK